MYLRDNACPVGPCIPNTHNYGAVLCLSPIEVSGCHNTRIKLLACVIVAENSLSLKVTALMIQVRIKIVISPT